MNSIHPQTLRDLMAGHKSAEVINRLGNNVVRKLAVNGNDLNIDWCGPTPPGVPQVTPVSMNQTIFYDPWDMDRGSLMIQFKHVPDGFAKLCVEADFIRYDDGSTATIMPHPSAPKTDHEVRITHHNADGTKETIVTRSGGSDEEDS